ncbi:MAG: NUMOD3 domain-containing DNA-binding protein, partial [Sporomusa sp.]
IHTEESRRNMSNARKGKFCGADHHFYGKHHTKEAKEKCRIASTGRRQSAETIAKRVEKLRNPSADTRAKLSACHKGIPLSEEHKKKISMGNMGRKVSNETKRKISDSRKKMPVAQFALNGTKIAEYESLEAASQIFGGRGQMSSISRCCKGERKTAKGFKWEFAKMEVNVT